MRNITKTFGTIVANNKVNLDIYKGEILSLLGENGSGKTTLMNMLSGIYYPDEGEILIDGKPVQISSPKDAYDYGIGMIHQHFKLVNIFSAAQNIILGMESDQGVKNTRFGKLDIERASKRIREICDLYGFDVDPDQKVYDMSVSQKQTVEIVKVLYRGADILILDEPTAVLTPQETEKLFNVLRNMKADGKTVIIITHKLHEVEAISDRVAILRKGEYIGDLITSETNAQEMTNMMVGREVELNIDRPEPKNVKPRVIIKDMTVRSEDGILKLDHVSFTANTGEVLGIAGISGCGQKELLEAIAGLQPIEKGDRLGMGLVANMNLADNMMLRSFRRKGSIAGFTDRKTPWELAEKVVEELEVVTPGIETPVRRLSGGNVQKVLVGREIAMNPTVLMSAYAVRGLDINASYTIYDLINQQKERGVAVIFVGEDLDVLLELSDRILVLCGGKVSGIVDGRTADKYSVGLLMTKVGGDAVG